jgi:hypothetical protein
MKTRTFVALLAAAPLDALATGETLEPASPSRLVSWSECARRPRPGCPACPTCPCATTNPSVAA